VSALRSRVRAHVYYTTRVAARLVEYQFLEEDILAIASAHPGAFLRDKGAEKQICPTPALPFRKFLGALSGAKGCR